MALQTRPAFVNRGGHPEKADVEPSGGEPPSGGPPDVQGQGRLFREALGF